MAVLYAAFHSCRVSVRILFLFSLSCAADDCVVLTFDFISLALL